MNTEPLTTLKGIGEKTEKLFAKVGIYNLQQLLHYYPRDYDCYAEPVPLRECRQEEKNAVYGRIVHSPSVKGNQRKSVVVLESTRSRCGCSLPGLICRSAEHAEERQCFYLPRKDTGKIRPSRDGAAGNLHSCRIP